MIKIKHTLILLVAIFTTSILVSMKPEPKEFIGSQINVTFSNKSWKNGLPLQVRVGNSSNPDLCTEVYNGVLPYGQSYTATSNSMVYYRRSNNPDRPDGLFTVWTQVFTTSVVDNP